MNDDPDIVEGTVHDDVTGAPSMELAPRDRSTEVLHPVDADELVASFQAYQDLLPRLLTPSDYQTAERGKRFIKKSGYRKIARAFRLNVEVRQLQVDRDDEGLPVRATAIARATAPNGDFSDGDGHCSIQESRFRNQQARAKAENDLPATAVTRAKNRAISDLVGMGEVSADEINAYTHTEAEPLPDWARAATSDEARAAGATLAARLGEDGAKRVWGKVADTLGVPRGKLPVGVMTALLDGVLAEREPASDLPWGALPGDPPDEDAPSLLDDQEEES